MIKARVTKAWPFNVIVANAVIIGFLVHDSIEACNSKNDSAHVTSTGSVNEHTETTSQSSLAQLTNPFVEFVENNQFESFFARTNALLRLFENTDLATLRQYWEQCKNIELSNFRTEVQHLIVQRWAVLDPAGALNFVLKETVDSQQQDLLELVFLEWSHANIDEAIRFAHDLDQIGKETAVASIVRAREDLSIDRHREIARQLGCEWVAIEALGEEGIKDPESEWANFIDEHRDSLDDLRVEQRKVLAYIAYYWMVRDGAEVLAQMRAMLPRSFKLFEITEFVSQQLRNSHPRLALEVVNKFAIQEQVLGFRQLGVDVIRNWAEIEPDLALEATHTIELRSFRRELQGHVLKKTAESDPHAMWKAIDTFPEHLQAQAQEAALLEIAKDSPESVVSMLSRVPDKKVRERIESAVIKHWATKDIDGLLDRTRSDIKWAENGDVIMQNALKELAQTDLTLALEVAVSQPVGENGEGMELEVIRAIALSDLDLASTLLPNVRAGVTRTKCYSTVIFRSIVVGYEPELSIEMFLQLCELEADVPQAVISPLVSEIPERLFASLDRVTSESVKADVARSLLRWYGDDDVFTDEQLDSLRDMVQPLLILRDRSLLDEAREVLDSLSTGNEKDE